MKADFINFDKLEIIKGTFHSFVLRGLGFVFSYIFILIFAKIYKSHILGLYSIVLALFGLLSLFSSLGTQTSIVRFVAQYKKYDELKSIVKRVLLLTFPIAVFFAIFVFIFSDFISNNIFSKADLSIPLKITSFYLPFGIIVGIFVSALRGAKKIKEALAFQALIPLLNIFFLVTLTLIWGKHLEIPFVSNLLSTIIVSGIISYYFYVNVLKSIRNIKNNSNKKTYLKNNIIYNYKTILNISLPMFISSGMVYLMGWTDTFMLGIFKTSSEVGVYRIALKVTLLISIFNTSVYSIIEPKFAELYWGEGKKRLKEVASYSSRLMTVLTAPLVILIIIFSEDILNLFGDDFKLGKNVLIILSIAHLIKSVFGPVNYLLDMSDNQKLVRNSMFISAISNVLLNFILIPNYGINGAAVASFFSILILQSISAFYVYKVFKFWIGLNFKYRFV